MVDNANKVVEPESPSLAIQLRDFSKFNRKLPLPVPWDSKSQVSNLNLEDLFRFIEEPLKM